MITLPPLPPLMTNDNIVSVITQIESGGDVSAIGDNGKAFGLLQIQQPCLDDFNKWNGTKYVLDDLLGEAGAELSKRVFWDYMAHYATPRRLGRPVTPVDMAGIWNGGPNGWRWTATQRYRNAFSMIATKRQYV